MRFRDLTRSRVALDPDFGSTTIDLLRISAEHAPLTVFEGNDAIGRGLATKCVTQQSLGSEWAVDEAIRVLRAETECS